MLPVALARLQIDAVQVAAQVGGKDQAVVHGDRGNGAAEVILSPTALAGRAAASEDGSDFGDVSLLRGVDAAEVADPFAMLGVLTRRRDDASFVVDRRADDFTL